MSTEVSAGRPPPSGWYPDPTDPTLDRWWNGGTWASDTRAKGGPPTPPQYPLRHPGNPPPQPYLTRVEAHELYVAPVSAALATAGLVCGLVGLIVFPVALAPLAIVFGAVAPRLPNGDRHGRAKAALILGIADLALMVLLIAVGFSMF